MTKKLTALLFVILICMLSVAPAFATSDLPRLIDEPDFLDSTQEAELLARLDSLSEAHQFDFVVAIVDGYDGLGAQAYADDFFDYNGYGYGTDRDGSILLIGQNESQRAISTSGYGITAFTDAGISYIGSQIVSDLDTGYYYDAIDQYITLCEEFIVKAENGDPFDTDDLPKEGFKFFKNLLISLAVGFVIAFIVTMIMKSQLKSVRSQSAAADYMRSGSLNIHDSRDMFLYKKVTKVKKEENKDSGSSTHTSSSGRTHGGGTF